MPHFDIKMLQVTKLLNDEMREKMLRFIHQWFKKHLLSNRTVLLTSLKNQ